MTKKISLFLMLLSIVASFFMFTGYATLSDELTINGTVSATPSEHTVNWLNYTAETNDENEEWEVIETDYPVLYGSTPQYNGDTPTRMATDQYTYTFTGWSTRTVDENGKESFTNVDISQYEVKADVDFYAVYNVVTNSYTVTWVNWDGTELEKDENIYNTNPTYDGATPTRPADAQYTYTFAGWEPTVSPVTGDVTYTAQYNATVNKYTITWNVDGVETSEEVEYGLIPTHENPEKTGYDFAGWQSSNGTVYAADSIPAVSGDETYTATWTPISYEIKYDLDGGSVTGNPTTYTIETATITLNNPTRKGYTFVGWTGTGLDSATKTVTIAKGSTGERSYTATWRANNYTIAFDGNGSTSGSTASVNATYDKDATLTANGFSKTGYTFIGWLAPDGAIYDDKATVKNLAASGTVTLIAQWDANEYTIKFNGKDSTSGSMSSISATYDKDVNLPANAYTKTGYTFDGWAENVFYGKSFVPTSEALNDIWYGPTSNWGYARLTDGSWNTNSTGRFSTKKLVSKDKENINTNEEDTSITFDATIDLAGTYRLSTMLIYCYNNDWRYAGSNFTVEFYNNGTKVKTLSYADLSQFVEGNYIKLELDDVEATSVKIYTSNAYANGLSISMLEIECYGSVVYEDRATVKNLTATNGGTVTLFAQLTPNKYTIEFNANGGSGTMNSITATYDQNAQLPANAFTRTGYTFKGWATSAGGNVAYANEAQLVKNLTATNGGTATLYAIWTPNTNTAYKVEHYKMNLDGTYPTTATETENKTGTTGASVTPAVKSYTGFTAPSTRTVTIAGNGSTVVKYYYERNNYTIKFVNEDGRELQLSSVPYDATPSYSGATPTKAATAQYTYTFKGWSPSIVSVTGEATYTATYTATVNKYTIKFVNEDGTVLQSSSVAYGTTPSYSGATPTKAATAQYTYTFKGWSPSIVSVTGEATYTATYSSTVNKYTIKFVNEDGTVLQSSSVAYGTTPVYSGATPTKAATAQYTYTFSGWSPEVSTVTGEATYTAQFSSTVNKYTVTWKNHDGSVLETDANVSYGSTPTYNGATPTKTATAQYTYTFSGWTPEISTVAGNVTYTAKFTSTVNKYTITWKNHDGSVLETDANVSYGSTPTYNGATPTKTGHTFTTWSPTIGTVKGNTVYTAQFTINQYTITFVTNGGSEVAAITQDYGTVVDEPQTTKTGYTFQRWCTDESLSATSKYTFTTMPAENITLYAKWLVNKYTIVFDKNAADASGTMDDIETDYNDPQTLPANEFIRTGYTFNGWLGSNGKTYTAGQSVTKLVTENNGTITLYAQWTINSYTITWVDGDGKTLKTDTIAYGETPVYSGSTPTKKATAKYTYTFKAWSPAITTVTGDATYTAQFDSTVNKYTITWETGDGKWSDDSTADKTTSVSYGVIPEAPETPTREGYTFNSWSPSIVSVTGEATYTATWTPITYSIKFYDNSSVATGTMKNQTMTYDKAQNLTANGFSRTGYTFAGWATSTTGNVVYTDQQSVNNLASTQGAVVELHAKWTPNSYSIKFDANGGSGSMSDIAMTYDTAKNLTANAFTKTGYTFSGWKDSSGNTYSDKQSVNNLVTTNNGTITLTAQWTAIRYSIQYIANDGTSTTDTQGGFVYDTADNLKNNPFTRTGYTFAGWNTEDDGSGTSYANKAEVKNLASTNGATVKLYAQWTANTYTIKFAANGGTGSMSDLTMTYGTAKNLTANVFTKTGYTFNGWKDSNGNTYSDKQSVNNLVTTNNGTITLTAQWTANTYTIVFDANGGSGTMSNLGMTYDTAKNLTANAFTRTGYTFAGWATSAGGAVVYEDKASVNNLTTTANGTVNLYAQWTINQYTITCNPMGGEFSTGLTTNWTTIVNYNTVPNVPNNVDKPGYTFIGWSTSETGGEVITESNLPAATRDVTYYAQFTANNYTVIYNPNGGSLLGGPASITSNNLIPYPFTETTLTRNGITFTDNGDGTITVTGTVESGKTNAVFNIMGNGATISFPLGYYRIGSGVSTTLNAYFCTNNTTTGRDPGGIKIFEFTSANNLSGLKIRIGAGVTLPAAGLVFRPSLERISQHTYDTASNLSSNVFVREGYKFLGWSTNKDATTAQYTDGDEITKLAASGEVTLYAVWEKQCKVTWMSDDGNILRIDYIDKGTTPSYGVDPIKDAKVYEYYDANGNLKSAIGATYTFAGWDKTIGNVTSNVTYTARFTETKKQVTVTINYMTSNGVALNPQNVANPLNSNKPFNFPTTISVNIGEVTRIKSSNIPKLNSNGSVVVTDNKVNYQYYVVNENTDITAYTNTTITVYYTVGGGTGNNADTAYAGGDGLTPETAYEIAGVADFLYFRNQVNNGNNYKGYYFKLTKTINLTETTSSHMVGVRYDESGNPIYTEFQGTFDGQNHRITGLNIAGSEKDRYVGLFASVGQYGTVKNVITLSGSGAAIKSNYPAKPADYVETDEETYPYGAAGAIVGINKGIVDGCVNYINMTTGITCDYIGGVVGYSAYFGSNTEHSQVINCRNYGNITRTSESGAVGGVVGVAAGIVKGCYNSGTIEGKTSVGGIIGTVYHESIEISYNMNYGAVKVYSYNGGGIIGLSNAQTVHHNVNYGTITAENTATNIGGIIGGDTGNRVSILDASKNVIGRKIKYDAGSVSDNINYGTISGHHSAGGIVGVTESNLVNNINRGTIIGDYDIGGIAGKTYDINVTGCINYAQVTATGSLSVGNVLDACAGGIIGSAEQTKISNCTNNGAVTATEENVRAVAGIVGNVTTGTIGSSLNGTFTAAYIKNCINNGTITGSRFTAGIAGRLYDLNNTITVSYCINNGFIIASSWINGGLVGSMSHTNMTYSVNNGYVNSETSGSAGGLVGAVYSTSSVSHSQNHGTIRVLDNAAGLVHELDGRLENCDNTGTVIATNKGGKAVYFAAITSGGGTMSGCKNYAYSSTFTGNAFSGKTFTPTAEAEGDIYSSNFPYSKLTDGSDDNDTRRFSTLVDVNNSVVDATLSLGSATYVSQMTIKLYSESSKPAIEYAGRDFMVQVKVNGVWMTVIDCNTNDDISKYLSGDTLTFELGNILATEVRIYSSGCINNSRSISIREITCTGAASDVFTK